MGCCGRQALTALGLLYLWSTRHHDWRNLGYGWRSKNLEVNLIAFQHIQPVSASIGHFLDTKEPYYASTGNKTGMEV